MFFCGFGRKRPASRFRSLHVGQVDVHVGQVQDLSVQKLNLKNNYWKLFWLDTNRCKNFLYKNWTWKTIMKLSNKDTNRYKILLYKNEIWKTSWKDKIHDLHPPSKLDTNIRCNIFLWKKWNMKTNYESWKQKIFTLIQN